MGPFKCLIATALFAFAEASLEMCLQRDSISCIQLQIYKTAKNYLQGSHVELIGGLTLSSRSGKSLDGGSAIEEAVLTSAGVEERQRALEDYFSREMKHLWNDGSVSWSPTKAAKSLIDSIPVDVKAEITSWQGEGRGKSKKQMQMLMPLLVGIKLKMAALAALGYMGIAIIAKKAVLAGVISLVVSGFIAIKNLIESHRKHEEMTAYHAAWEPPIMSPWQTGVYEHDQAAAATAVAAAQRRLQVAYAPVTAGLH